MNHETKSDGCTLHYSASGSGPALLFIQGVGVHGDGWRPQIEELARDHTCLAFDNRGLGRNRPAGAPITVERMAEDALAILEHARIPAAHVVGHSLGGQIALQLALSHPERVNRLSLLCTFADGRAPARGVPMLWIGMRTRIGTRRMRRRAFLELLLPPQQRQHADLGALARELEPLFGHDLADQPPVAMQQIRAFRRCNLAPRLGELARIPTLVVSATYDRIAPPALGQALATGIPGARYVEIEDAAHGAPITHAARINALLREP